jgi:hypothetical protein
MQAIDSFRTCLHLISVKFSEIDQRIIGCAALVFAATGIVGYKINSSRVALVGGFCSAASIILDLSLRQTLATKKNLEDSVALSAGVGPNGGRPANIDYSRICGLISPELLLEVLQNKIGSTNSLIFKYNGDNQEKTIYDLSRDRPPSFVVFT